LKRVTIKGKALASRISGVSIGLTGVGISWKPSEPERNIVRSLIVALEDKRALYVSNDREVEHYVVHSMDDIRKELTSALKALEENSKAVDSIKLMRGACQAFMTATQRDAHGRNFPRFDNMDGRDFFIELGKLRAIFGQQLAVLAYLYSLAIDEGLASTLPPLPE